MLDEYLRFYAASTTASAGFAGLLFVALSVVNKDESQHVTRERRTVLAGAALLALADIFFVSLLSSLGGVPGSWRRQAWSWLSSGCSARVGFIRERVADTCCGRSLTSSPSRLGIPVRRYAPGQVMSSCGDLQLVGQCPLTRPTRRSSRAAPPRCPRQPTPARRRRPRGPGVRRASCRECGGRAPRGSRRARPSRG
jgi:hypothetical protein